MIGAIFADIGADFGTAFSHAAFYVPILFVLFVAAADFAVGGYIFKGARWADIALTGGEDAGHAPAGPDPARAFFGRAAWGASVVAFAAVLAGAGAVTVAVMIAFLPVWVTLAFCSLALGLAAVVYPLPVVPMTDRILRHAFPPDTARCLIALKNAQASAGTAVLVLAVGASAGTLLPAAGSGGAEAAASSLRLVMFAHAGALMVAVLNVYATHYLPAAQSPGPGQAALKRVAAGITLYLGTTQTLYLAAIYIPAIVVLEAHAATGVPATSGVADGSGKLLLEIATVLGPAVAGVLSVIFGRTREDGDAPTPTAASPRA